MELKVEVSTTELHEAETTIDVFGIKTFVHILCKFEENESEYINSDDFVFSTGDNHTFKVGGAWHEAICDIVQDKVIDRIYDIIKGKY